MTAQNCHVDSDGAISEAFSRPPNHVTWNPESQNSLEILLVINRNFTFNNLQAVHSTCMSAPCFYNAFLQKIKDLETWVLLHVLHAASTGFRLEQWDIIGQNILFSMSHLLNLRTLMFKDKWLVLKCQFFSVHFFTASIFLDFSSIKSFATFVVLFFCTNQHTNYQ